MDNTKESLLNKLDKRIEEKINICNNILDRMDELKFKKLSYDSVDAGGNVVTMESTATLPVKAHDTDAGYDLVATRLTQEIDGSGKMILVYHTDIAVEIPIGYVGLLFMRSSISNYSLILTNATGVIDSGYRGELMMKYKVTTDALPRIYNIGDKIGQLVIVPCLMSKSILVDELSESDRGTAGYGSTDKEDSNITTKDNETI